MRYRDLLVVWSMLLATAVGTGCAARQKQTMRVQDVPAPVQETIRREAPATTTRIEVERKRVGNRDLFEIEMSDGLREIEILVDEQGRLVSQDEADERQDQRRQRRENQ